jgi:DNA (cytosine-5)-methyltransferase 1
LAGKKKGKDDERYLWPETLRIIRECKPTWFIGENVTGIVNMELDNILDDLEKEGYETQSFNIPACAVNAPHRRERIWIIAYRNSERCNIGSNNRKERSIQEDFNRYIEEIHKEWPQFLPESWKTFNAQNWLDANPYSVTGEKVDSSSVSIKIVRDSWLGHSRQDRGNYPFFNWQKDQPPIPGMDDGLPDGFDRNKSLGNSIVPQIAFIFMKIIKTFLNHYL